MRLKNFIKEKEYNHLSDFISMCESTKVVPDNTFDALVKAADKVGIRIKRTETVWDYLKDASKKLNNIVRNVAIYLSTDISNKPLKGKIADDIKKEIKTIDKKELFDFLLQLDKSSFGISSHIRHALQSLAGIELSSYNNWLKDHDYIEQEIKNLKAVMQKVGASKEEMQTIDKLQNMISKYGKDE
jgi:hypothetical protein